MRQIVLDTETTGLDWRTGDRVIEIGCIELDGRRHSKRRYHRYLNPERQVDPGALAVHGLTDEFLADKSKFAEIVHEWIEFIRDAELVIHNAAFDVGFLNNELQLLNLPPIETLCAGVIDTLKMARAFGLGVVLATQNPVDVDYKGMSNIGTWFIGKLATDQDKARLLDGLSSADGSVNVKELDRLISGIGKRVFLMRNVHEKRPLLFQTRWAMNYLAGPLTRTQIPALNALKGVDKAAPRPSAPAAPVAPTPGRLPDPAPTSEARRWNAGARR